MSFCRRTVEDRLPLERVPLACTFGSPLDLHVRQSLGLQGPVDLDPERQGGGGYIYQSSAYITPAAFGDPKWGGLIWIITFVRLGSQGENSWLTPQIALVSLKDAWHAPGMLTLPRAAKQPHAQQPESSFGASRLIQNIFSYGP